MNTQTKEALKMAMRGIESMFNAPDSTLFAPDWLKIYNACKEAIVSDVTDIDVGEIAQPAQEPVAFTNEDELSELQSGMTTCYMYKQAIDNDDIPLYTHPAPSWQGLSDDETAQIQLMMYEWEGDNQVVNLEHLMLAVAQKLKEKNHG